MAKFNLFGLNIGRKGKSDDDIASLLGTSPELLNEFEHTYHDLLENLDDVSEAKDYFDVNSRQAAAHFHNDVELSEESERICRAIVEELVSRTATYTYDGISRYSEATEPKTLVSKREVNALPEKQRPQLTGTMIVRDTSGDPSDLLMHQYMKYMEVKDPEEKRMYYCLFRQGLDIMDLTPVMYEMLSTNPNSMGHWLPKLVEANKNLGFFRIPKTVVAKVPLPLLQLSRLDFDSLTEASKMIADKWAQEVFHLDPSNPDGYFIKTGTYSSKFDFRNAKVTDPKEILEIAEYLIYIQNQACMMAGPLTHPCIYGVSTTNEWVVREYIQDKGNNPCIYKGLPLRTEYRVFIDCDTGEVLGISPYWEPEMLKNRFSTGDDKDSPHQRHDYIIIKAHEAKMMEEYSNNRDMVLKHVEDLLPWLDLKGQWSLDIMQNGDDFWLIDMALAGQSAFYTLCVPEEKRRPIKEDWLPKLPGLRGDKNE